MVDIIFVIMGDIKYFMVIFIIFEVAFVTAYPTTASEGTSDWIILLQPMVA